MPHTHTYAFTAFTEEDLLEGKFDFDPGYQGQAPQRSDHEDEIDVYGVQWGIASSKGQAGANFDPSAEVLRRFETGAGELSADTFDLLF